MPQDIRKRRRKWILSARLRFVMPALKTLMWACYDHDVILQWLAAGIFCGQALCALREVCSYHHAEVPAG